MHWRLIISTLLLLILLAACEPMGPIPGRSLSGDIQSPPESWNSIGSWEIVQLETRADNKPYSVNIWGVAIGKFYYVASADGGETRWAQRIAKNPSVRLRVDRSIFELVATIVTDRSELDAAALAFSKKYDVDTGEDFPNVTLYRLESD